MPEALQEKGETLKPGKYQVVAWDLDTTGRRLIDEICQIGGFCKAGVDQKEGDTFSQYVMPYRNPNPGARRSFGIKVVNIGRYRMLKDINSGKILKTKSEVSALQDFIGWLEVCRGSADGVILVCHEPQRKVLGPLLLEALYKYNLLESFNKVVKGFCNSVAVVSSLGDSSKITSLSLRSLCKTVLGDTQLPTNSATDRCTVLWTLLKTVTNGSDIGVGLESSHLLPFTNSVTEEEFQLKQLKNVLGTQGTLRPIFESQLKQKRLVRERAIHLRRTIAEAGLEYSSLSPSLADQSLIPKLESVGATREDIEEIIKLIKEHFNIDDKSASLKGETAPVKVKVKEEKDFEKIDASCVKVENASSGSLAIAAPKEEVKNETQAAVNGNS